MTATKRAVDPIELAVPKSAKWEIFEIAAVSQEAVIDELGT